MAKVSHQRWARCRNVVVRGTCADGEWVAEVHALTPEEAEQRTRAIAALPLLLAALGRIAAVSKEPAVLREAEDALRLAGEEAP